MADEPIRRDRWWIFPDGTRLPVISGGEGPESTPATGDPTTPATGTAPAPAAEAPEAQTVAQRKELGGGEAGLKADLAAERKKRHDIEAQLKELSPLAAKAKELEEASKSETEKLAEKLRTAETKGTTAETELNRLKVAMAEAPDGMSPAKILSLAGRLRGTTDEELKADAVELFKDFGGTSNEADPPADPPAPGAPRPDPAQGSRGAPPAARPTSLGQAVGAALARPRT